MDNTKNIVFWPRAAGLGDLFKVLAGGMAFFKSEPFELVCGRHTPSNFSNFSHYENYYDEITNAFFLCTKATFKNLKSIENVNVLQKNLETTYANLLILPDIEEPEKMHARELCSDKREYILKRYSKYMNPPLVRKKVQYLINKNKINICVHLRYLFIKENDNLLPDTALIRNVNLKKWVEFLLHLQIDERFNIILIGDNELSSPFFIDEKQLIELRNHNNISFAAWDLKTTLQEDIYIIKECDIFIGAHSGITSLAMLLNKPLISFDWGVPIKILAFHNSLIQKRYFLTQDINEMKRLFYKFLNESYFIFKNKTVKMLFDIQEKKLKNEISCFFQKQNSLKKTPILGDWNNFEDAYIQLGLYSLGLNMFAQAEHFFSLSDEAIPIEGFQLYKIARSFKDNKLYKSAVIFFKKSISWAFLVNRIDVLVASYFHIGEIYIDEKKFGLALQYLTKCLNRIPNHKKAKSYILELLKDEMIDIIIWGTSKNYEKELEEHLSELNVIGFIENNCKLWGHNKNEIEIFNPVDLTHLKPDMIIICSSYREQIKGQISAMNLSYKFSIINF